MQRLQNKILTDGVVKAGGVLKVDGFLNHRIDIDLTDAMALEFYEHFKTKPINKIVTIEASGIGVACMTARYFHAPVVFAKKEKTSQLDDRFYTAAVHSFTHQNDYHAIISRDYLSSEDHVLVIDDFLAMGEATRGLMELIRQAGATLEGVGIAIEKGFQPGGAKLREAGIDLYSLAIVESMNAETGEILFRE